MGDEEGLDDKDQAEVDKTRGRQSDAVLACPACSRRSRWIARGTTSGRIVRRRVRAQREGGHEVAPFETQRHALQPVV